MSDSAYDKKIDKQRGAVAVGLAATLAVVLVIIGSPFLFAFLAGWNSLDAGHIGVVRSGGWFQDSNIRGYLDPASSMTDTGMFSTLHVYPAQQQIYTISADPAQGSTATTDSIDVPSSDGVEITIDGSLYYSLNLSHPVLGQFDNRFGTQEYTWDGESYHPYQGADGWGAFINAVVRPTLQNELRTAMSQVSCAHVDPACALVQNSTQAAAVASGAASSDGNLGQIQDQINKELATDLQTQLGGTTKLPDPADYFFQGLRFTITTVTLPATVQTAIDNAQSAFAKVSSAQAAVNAATLQAQAAEIAQQGYAKCPVCAVIAEEQALPGNITTYAPGAPFAVGAGGQ